MKTSTGLPLVFCGCLLHLLVLGAACEAAAVVAHASDASSMDAALSLTIPARRLHAEDVNGPAENTTGSDIIQQLPGDATFSYNERLFPRNQSAALSLVLSLTPAVVSAACITPCLFLISLLIAKTVAWCVQMMLAEVFGILL